MSLRLWLLLLVLIVSSLLASMYLFKENYTEGQMDTNVVIGCHDEPLKPLECEENYVLEKGRIRWGRWDKNVCSTIDTKKFKPIRDTIFQSKYYDIPKEFLGKQITNFEDPTTKKPLTAMDIAKENPTAPTRKNFSGKASLPVYNHYQLSGVCKPISSELSTVSGCANDKLKTVSCPDGFIIPGARIKYGRWDNEVCLDDTVTKNTQKKFMEVRVPDQYMGKQSIDWGDATIGSLVGDKDPYVGVSKHYEITAECKKPAVTI